MNRCIAKYGDFLPTILLSYPHFLHATGDLSNSVDGLNANYKDHGNYVKFEPTTGVPIELAKRMQFSVVARKVESVSNFRLLDDEVVMPIAYVDIYRDDPKIARMLYNTVVRTASFIDNWLVWIMIWGASAFLLYAFYRDKEKIAKKIEKTQGRMPPRNNLELMPQTGTFATIPEDGPEMDFTRNESRGSARNSNRFAKKAINKQPRKPNRGGTNLNRLDSRECLSSTDQPNALKITGRTRSSNSYNEQINDNSLSSDNVKRRNNLRDRPKTLNFKISANFGRNAVTTPVQKYSNDHHRFCDSPSNISRVSSRIAGRLADTPVSEIVEKMSNIIPNSINFITGATDKKDDEHVSRPLLYCVSPSSDKGSRSEDTSVGSDNEFNFDDEKTK